MPLHLREFGGSKRLTAIEAPLYCPLNTLPYTPSPSTSDSSLRLSCEKGMCMMVSLLTRVMQKTNRPTMVRPTSSTTRKPASLRRPNRWCGSFRQKLHMHVAASCIAPLPVIDDGYAALSCVCVGPSTASQMVESLEGVAGLCDTARRSALCQLANASQAQGQGTQCKSGE